MSLELLKATPEVLAEYLEFSVRFATSPAKAMIPHLASGRRRRAEVRYRDRDLFEGDEPLVLRVRQGLVNPPDLTADDPISSVFLTGDCDLLGEFVFTGEYEPHDPGEVVRFVVRGDDHDKACIPIAHEVLSPVLWDRRQPTAKRAAGINSSAVVQSRAMTASTSAASLAMIGCSKTTKTPSRIPAPAGAKIAIYPAT